MRPYIPIHSSQCWRQVRGCAAGR